MDSKIVWSDSQGDVRKKKVNDDEEVQESSLELHLRRLTSGKGRVVIEISQLPKNKKWCKKLAQDLKKKLATGGAYKSDVIEVHGEKLVAVCDFLRQKGIRYKQTGG